MTKRETLAYLAGIIDGEGYIGIKKDPIRGRAKSPSYYVRMSVAGLHKPMIEMLIETFGAGRAYFHKPSKLSKRGYWSWDITCLQAVAAIKSVYPYLLIKKPEADLVLKLNESKGRAYQLVPEGVNEYREGLYQAVKALHSFAP